MKKNHQALRATLLLVVMLVGAVAALYRVPVASAAPAMEVVPGDPIPETIPEETVPETTEAPEDPEPYRPVPQPQHEHNVVVDSVDATCTQDGYVHEYCTTCGVSLSYTPIAALGHDYHETARVEPQIGVDGYIEYTCVRNDDSYRTPLEALPEPEETEEEEPAHTHVKVVTHVAATCTTDGYKHVECYECGEVLEHTVVPAHGHSWNGWHVVRAATYEAEGLEQHECTKCGVVETRPIAKLTRPVEEEKPSEPAPTEPQPTEPAPTEPAPTEPEVTEPAPTEPAPTEPEQPEEGKDACEDFIF